MSSQKSNEPENSIVPAKATFYIGGSLGKAQRKKHKLKTRSTNPEKRGVVHSFSRASRLRLLRQVAKIRRDADALFVTLTYPDKFPEDPLKWKRDLKVFSARLKRLMPESSFIWRLELQERKSGLNTGKLAPHYHLLVYGVLDSTDFDLTDFRSWLSKNWFECVGSNDERHLMAGTNCTEMRSWRGAMSYASKYMGKNTDFEIENVGRHWGVYFRKNLPEASPVELELTDKQASDLIRMFRKVSDVPSRDYSSLTVFLDAEQWHEKLADYFSDHSPN